MIFQRGDIVFVMHKKNPISRDIAWFMGSRWSHSALVIDSSDLRTYLCETSDFQVTIATLDRYLIDPDTSLEVWRLIAPIDPRTMERMLTRAISYEGQLFGYLQLLSLGLRRMLKRIGIQIPNFIRQGMVCTAIPLHAYSISRVPGLDGIDPESIDTEDLYVMLKQYGYFSMVYSKP